MEAHQDEYKKAKQEFTDLVQALINEISSFDDLGVLTPDKCMYRLHRDIRFSKDKTPYKTYFSAAFGPGGKKYPGALYYVHIDPSGKSFLGGGSLCLDKEHLNALRDDIEDSTTLSKIISKNSFIDTFANIEGEKLKKVPRGYSPDSRSAELLKHKTFCVHHPLTQKIYSDESFPKYTKKIFREMKPFLDYVNSFVAV